MYFIFPKKDKQKKRNASFSIHVILPHILQSLFQVHCTYYLVYTYIVMIIHLILTYVFTVFVFCFRLLNSFLCFGKKIHITRIIIIPNRTINKNKKRCTSSTIFYQALQTHNNFS